MLVMPSVTSNGVKNGTPPKGGVVTEVPSMTDTPHIDKIGMSIHGEPKADEHSVFDDAPKEATHTE